jgi:hypothetical protein
MNSVLDKVKTANPELYRIARAKGIIALISKVQLLTDTQFEIDLQEYMLKVNDGTVIANLAIKSNSTISDDMKLCISRSTSSSKLAMALATMQDCKFTGAVPSKIKVDNKYMSTLGLYEMYIGLILRYDYVKSLIGQLRQSDKVIVRDRITFNKNGRLNDGPTDMHLLKNIFWTIYTVIKKNGIDNHLTGYLQVMAEDIVNKDTSLELPPWVLAAQIVDVIVQVSL